MIKDIDNTLKKLNDLQATNNDSIQKSINNLLSELKNIKSILSPVKVDASNNASKLTPTMGATIKCSFSLAPSSYMSIRATALASNLPSSNITDSKLGANILPFAGCTNPTNPTMNPVVFPWVCMPMISPFLPINPTVLLQGAPITTISSKAFCNFAAGGVVNFINSGQVNVKTS